MALTYSSLADFKAKIGSSPPSFSLRGVDDQIYSLSDFREAEALVVMFMCNHCPYVIAIQKRLNQLVMDYQSKGVAFVGINSNDSLSYPADSFEEMKKRAKEQNYSFPYLRDETQEVARAFGAVCTPEFHAYGKINQDLKLKYVGRLDDNWKDEKKVTRRDLAEALDAILLGKDPFLNESPAMGCNIKWKVS